MDWAKDGRDWPNNEHSRFVACRPHRWHVQAAGEGPVLLLLHGAGGATQSFRDLLPLLARRFTVVAPDLPGQGFTSLGTRQRCGLAPMAEDIARLCEENGWRPHHIVGHSAGGAIALQLALHWPVKSVVCLNGALGTFEGLAGWLFPVLAKLLAMNPLVPRLFARLSSTEKRVSDLLASTGSQIDPRGVGLYRRLVADRAHVEGTLLMMAQWRVEGLMSRLDRISAPVLFLTAENDRSVPPATSVLAAAKVQDGEIVELPGLGHLAHEEAPERVAEEILAFIDRIETKKPPKVSGGS
ncbi:alpha/beta fold hydrolase BchO [Tranquillimonas alkanivorans]|uniref:Magnesium chelatase accessory protein n=1 Tax=Tranquillimonas alkanivorans TaxID=441119 RepID=A0A1I5LD81_9RHOB|nr:alpha/beta fold hydrolase BchO [Tranquillimonas alkanivorans]SFO94816.1 magnesium chelatase accessory protein [Tranquillimonas alkanivorans]